MRLQAVQTVHEVAAQHMDLTPAQVGPGVLQQLNFNGTLFISLLAYSAWPIHRCMLACELIGYVWIWNLPECRASKLQHLHHNTYTYFPIVNTAIARDTQVSQYL